jgi:iron complex outermembrane receptor protein
VNVRGNLGLQIQRTDQSSTRQRASTRRRPRRSDRRQDLHRRAAEPEPGLRAWRRPDRCAWPWPARWRGRASTSCAAALDFGIDTATGKPGASGGNSKLDPWRANAFDLSYEKYFGTKAYVAAAYFYKDLRSYIYTQTRDGYDFSDGSSATCRRCRRAIRPAASPPGTFTAPFNGKGGTLQGLELSASLPLDLFSPALEGFGIVASASFNDSSIAIRTRTAPAAWAAATSPARPVQARLQPDRLLRARRLRGPHQPAQARSDFIGEIGNFAATARCATWWARTSPTHRSGYNFTEGSLKGLGLLLQASNLTNEAYQTYAGTKRPPARVHQVGPHASCWARTTSSDAR